MILESLVTTLDEQGHVNLAPLGPIVLPLKSTDGLPQFLLRPYEGSTTCDNLLASGNAVIHVIDDALLIAKTAIGKVDATEKVVAIPGLEGTHVRLKRCHRWFAVQVTISEPERHRDMSSPRAAWIPVWWIRFSDSIEPNTQSSKPPSQPHVCIC